MLFDLDVICTRNLLIWGQTRYRCATKSAFHFRSPFSVQRKMISSLHCATLTMFLYISSSSSLLERTTSVTGCGFSRSLDSSVGRASDFYLRVQGSSPCSGDCFKIRHVLYCKNQGAVRVRSLSRYRQTVPVAVAVSCPL